MKKLIISIAILFCCMSMWGQRPDNSEKELFIMVTTYNRKTDPKPDYGMSYSIMKFQPVDSLPAIIFNYKSQFIPSNMVFICANYKRSEIEKERKYIPSHDSHEMGWIRKEYFDAFVESRNGQVVDLDIIGANDDDDLFSMAVKDWNYRPRYWIIDRRMETPTEYYFMQVSLIHMKISPDV